MLFFFNQLFYIELTLLYNLNDDGYCIASKAKECSGYEPDKTVYEQYLTYAHHYEEVMH